MKCFFFEKYKMLKRGILRETASKESDKVADLKPGDIVEVDPSTMQGKQGSWHSNGKKIYTIQVVKPFVGWIKMQNFRGQNVMEAIVVTKLFANLFSNFKV